VTVAARPILLRRDLRLEYLKRRLEPDRGRGLDRLLAEGPRTATEAIELIERRPRKITEAKAHHGGMARP
jgi:hypothetical protein